MRRSLTLVLAMVLAALVFAPAAFAQDDNPTGDDRGGERGFDDNPSRDDLGADDNGEDRGFDDNPTGDDLVASPTATATVSATNGSGTDTTVLPSTGGASIVSLLPAAGLASLVASGIVAAMLLSRQASS